ncbi:MAG: hypothetical protein JNL82_17660 [Myxococcales bacterium]|nr:hypothetical protein [Myxococcales bacterium]
MTASALLARRPGRLALGAAFGVGLACSTLRPFSPITCEKDEDCPNEGEVCEDNECFPNTLPPPAQVGLDVAGADVDGLRVEIVGTDASAERIIEQKPVRYRARLNNANLDGDSDGSNDTPIPGVRDRLIVTAQESFLQGDELLTIDLAADLEFNQTSRLRREPVKAVRNFLLDEDMTPIPNPGVTLPWARYSVDSDLNGDFPLVLTVRAATTTTPNGQVVRAPVHRQLARKQLGVADTFTFDVPTRRECHRFVIGNAVVIGSGGAPGGVVAVDLRHSHSAPEPGKSVCDATTKQQAVCAPDTVFPNELPSCTTSNDCPAPYGCYAVGDAKKCGCDSDAECRTGQICELESHRCALDLQGLPATSSNVVTAPDSADFGAWVYTYCEDDLEADREMSFVARATPAIPDDGDVDTPIPASPYPTLSFDVTVDFPASNADTVQLPGSLCFPPWQPPINVRAALTSAPKEVFVDAMDRPWVCCSTACLDQELSAPPPAPVSCPVTGELSARTRYTQAEADKLAHNCLPLTALDKTSPPGSQWVDVDSTPLGNCTDADSNPVVCEISLSPGAGSLDYDLRLIPPVGSLVRSMTYTATVDAGTAELPPPPELAYRVLLRGQVALQADPGSTDQCGTDGQVDPSKCVVKAEVLAERIRLPSEDPATVLPPYFYTTNTLAGAEFVLPVNPGVYLLTAIPEIASPGGPARISIVDLRLTSDLVEPRDDVPTVTLKDPLLLAPQGQFVIVELDGFDFATIATPFDLSSWLGLEFEGRALDLNDPGTCHGDPGRACSIRRLRPGNSGLALTQEQFVKFITRGRCERAGADEDPECQKSGE